MERGGAGGIRILPSPGYGSGHHGKSGRDATGWLQVRVLPEELRSYLPEEKGAQWFGSQHSLTMPSPKPLFVCSHRHNPVTERRPGSTFDNGDDANKRDEKAATLQVWTLAPGEKGRARYGQEYWYSDSRR